jgi:glycosyltransferase involved in cell wall biosynthesis
MKIGVDARMLCKPTAGIGRFIIEIGQRIARINPDIIFYTPNNSGNHLSLNIKASAWSSLTPKSFEQFWAHTILPYSALRDKVEVFWAPSHRLPLFFNKKIAQVLTIHDLVWVQHPSTMKLPSWLLERIHMPYSISKADRVVAISDSTDRDLRQKFPKFQNKFSVIKPGFNNFFTMNDLHLDNDLATRDKYILFVGTFEPRKNLNRLMEAFSMLPMEIKSRHNLVIAGLDGWGGRKFGAQVKHDILAGRIKFLGYVSDEYLKYLYSNALFLTMPSLYEGFGLPILESMSFGVPVLTSDCSSMPEVSGDAAIFVNPSSTESIFDGLMKMIVDDNLRLTLSLNAKKNIENFSWDRCAKQLIGIFECALASKHIK